MHQRSAVGSHFAETSVLRAKSTRNGIFLQNGRDSSAQAVARQVLHSAVGLLQRGQGLLVPLGVPDEMQRNQRVVKHVSQGMRSCDIQRISVVDDRFFVGVSFLEPPRIWDGVIAVVQNQRRCWSRRLRRFFFASSFFSATDRPNFLGFFNGSNVSSPRLSFGFGRHQTAIKICLRIFAL